MPIAKSNTDSRSANLPPSRQRLSMTAENYLLSIYRLNEEGTAVTLTLLAEHLKMLPEGEGLGTEHAISPYLEERIMDKLGMPTTSPFGYPIPGTDYSHEFSPTSSFVSQVTQM